LIEVYSEKQKEQVEEKTQIAIITAYYTEYLHRIKKMPKLEKLLNIKKKQSTDEELFNVVKNINAMLGGQTIEKGG
jgi:3-deoxy-D-manno-octulosonic acid (KDO) 8-phosphate synthase